MIITKDKMTKNYIDLVYKLSRMSLRNITVLSNIKFGDIIRYGVTIFDKYYNNHYFVFYDFNDEKEINRKIQNLIKVIEKDDYNEICLFYRRENENKKAI